MKQQQKELMKIGVGILETIKQNKRQTIRSFSVDFPVAKAMNRRTPHELNELAHRQMNKILNENAHVDHKTFCRHFFVFSFILFSLTFSVFQLPLGISNSSVITESNKQRIFFFEFFFPRCFGKSHAAQCEVVIFNITNYYIHSKSKIQKTFVSFISVSSLGEKWVEKRLNSTSSFVHLFFFAVSYFSLSFSLYILLIRFFSSVLCCYCFTDKMKTINRR